MNDPNDHHCFHLHHLETSQPSQQPASLPFDAGRDSENHNSGIRYPVSEPRVNSSFTRAQPLPLHHYYHQEFAVNQGYEREILEPCPIGQMTMINDISVQELLSRDPTTAQALLELFRYDPTFSSRMITSPYRRLPGGFDNLKETKLEPSSLSDHTPTIAVASVRRIRSKKVSSYNNALLPREHSAHFQEEAARQGSLKLPPSHLFRSASDATSPATIEGWKGDDEDDVTDEDLPGKKSRLRVFKSGQWFQRFHELVEYKERFGSCHVPHNWEHNVPLAQWVKRQRYQYTLREEGKHSTLTDERKMALDEIGFIWSSHGTTFSNRLEELQQFKREFGHCNVPKNYHANKALAVWIKSQRRQVRQRL
jgi:hypothetical protein